MTSSSTSSDPLILPSRPREPYISTPCPYPSCRTTLEYLPPSTSQATSTASNTFKVECFKCRQKFEPPNAGRTMRDARAGRSDVNGSAGAGPSSSASSSSGNARKPATKRRIGTDERPLDMTYYDILSLPATATQDDIKRSYRKLAIKLHPDKNPDDAEASERFKQLATAYSILSDPVTRHKYNEFGASTPGLVPEDGFVDPEEVFGSLFGGARFADVIGKVSIGKEMKDALQQDEEELERQANGEAPGASGSGDASASSSSATSSGLSPEAKAAKEAREKKRNEERARQREERVAMLTEKLVRKLSVYTESVRGIGRGEEELKAEVKKSFREITRLEAEELKQESYGTELLHVVGYIYHSKSRHYLASHHAPLSSSTSTALSYLSSPLGALGGMYHSLSSSAHIVSSTVSTVRAALELKSVFSELERAEKSPGGLSEERKRELEEKAAQKGMEALFKGASLEVESVIRDVCDRVLYGTGAGAESEGGAGGAAGSGGTGEVVLSKETQRLRATALGIVGSVFLETKPPAQGGTPGVTNGAAPGAADGEGDYVKVERGK